jgi:phosphoglycerate dehydrogenase-like enzyme
VRSSLRGVTVVCLPDARAREQVGDIAGVNFVIWDGSGDPPPDAMPTEFLVGEYSSRVPRPDALARLRDLRVIQLLSAGADPWLPVVPDGVTLCTAQGVHGASTAELAVAGMLAVLRQLPQFVRQQERSHWERQRGQSLSELKVLVVGAGDVGRRVEAAVRALDGQVSVVARQARDGVHAMTELPDLLAEHQVVVLAVPLTQTTQGLVDAAFLAGMPDQALLVNVARGPVVQTNALVAELTAGRLRAFLDVTDPEPLPPDHPLWQLPGVLLTPHVGGGTPGWAARGYRLVREQIGRFLAGDELRNVVRDG